MEFRRLRPVFAVCKIPRVQSADFSREFVFLAKTDDEISLVCESCCVPPDAIAVEDGWLALKIDCVLDFGMVGVLAGLTTLLAAHEISVFAVSTYNTDYLLFKKDVYNQAADLLRKAGHSVK